MLLMIKKSMRLALILLLPGCMLLGGSGPPKIKDDRLLFSEAQKSLDARNYIDAIAKFQMFTEQFPKAKQYTWALQRLGESYEGLLDTAYRRKIELGRDRETAAKEFLENYGHYNCWIKDADGIRYNLADYKMILEKFPESPIADEAAYRIISWEKDYQGRPEGIQKEIAQLEAVLEKYPDTSLRGEILYKLARRCRMLYEVYAFSPRAGRRDKDKAEQYRNKAVFIYKLSMESPENTKYSQKAWSELRDLEDGKKIYLLQ